MNYSKNRGLVKRALDKMLAEYKLGNVKEAEKWLKYSCKADIGYNKSWGEDICLVEDYLLERASLLEAEGEIKLAQVLFKQAENIEAVYRLVREGK